MSTSLALDSQRVGQDLYDLLQQLDPALWHGETATLAEAKLRALHAALQAVTASSSGALHVALIELCDLVEASLPSASTGDDTARWQTFRETAEPLYGELDYALHAYNLRLPMLRPTNYLRNSQHIGSAVLILVLLHYVLPTAAWRMGVASGALAVAAFLEVGRYLFPPMNRFLMRILGRIAHPHEAHRVNSSSWFILSLFVLSFFDIVYGTVAIAILGAADPAAAVIGRRYGRMSLVNGRTLEGTLTFWGVGTVVSVAALLLWFDYTLSHTVVMALAASLFAAIAELFSRRIDDNLAIPVAAAVGLWLVLTVG